VAANSWELEILQGILNWALKNLTREEVNTFLLSLVNDGRTVFHLAADFFELEVIWGIFNWAKKNLTIDE
jgi:hypothetical protein